MATTGKDTRISRRTLLGAAAPAALFTIVPRSVLGGAGYVPPSDRVNLAFIGVGAQGLRVMFSFLEQADVQAVSVCDVNKQSGDYPEWGENEFLESVRKMLGSGYSNWGEHLRSSQVIELTRTMKVTGGTAGREPARQMVDAYNGVHKRSGASKGCTSYNDFRELLEKESGVDAVVVCTTDHWHALISIAAMRKGKHVFCQKPMTHSVYEARRMAGVARETRVATQVAVGNQASEATRLLCEWIWDGAIGPVRQVHNWSSRPYWPQGIDRPPRELPVPDGLDWDLWLGPAPSRPFHNAYLPFVWRGWYDFGCGSLGDMGCYSFDTIFRVLKLGAPASVEAAATEMFKETYPKANIVYYNFPARGNMPPVKMTWYDGGLKPPRPEELEDGKDMSKDNEGLLFIGDKGAILCGFTGSKPRLIPESKMKAYKQPPKSLPRSPGNEREWLDACKGGKPGGANFEFSAVVTEALLLGNVATRAAGEKLNWDSANLKITNVSSANQYINPPMRGDWKL